MEKSNYIKFDVIVKDRYVCTMRYPLRLAERMLVDGSWRRVIDMDELTKFVLEKRPTLKNDKFRIEW